MSRGAKCLIAGIVIVVVSYIGGMLLMQAFFNSVDSRGPRGGFDTISRIAPWVGLVNLAFYAGVLAVIVGIVLLIIDSSRQPAPGSSETEEENRRLREEFKRARRERDD